MSISETQRRTTLELASTPGAVDVFLIQIRAGGVGLNLQEFSRVYLTSPDWNPCNEIQAIARAHRMGQQRAVVVTKLVLSGFVTGDDQTTVTPTSVIDNRILEVQQRKRMLMSDLLEEPDLAHNGTRRRLTRTDWKKLLR